MIKEMEPPLNRRQIFHFYQRRRCNQIRDFGCNFDQNSNLTLRQEVTPFVLETQALVWLKTDSIQQVPLCFSALNCDQSLYQYPPALFAPVKISFSFSLGVMETSLLWAVFGLLEAVLQMMSRLWCFRFLLTSFRK